MYLVRLYIPHGTREEGVCKHMYVSVHQRFNFLGYISTYLKMLALFFRILLLDAFCFVAEWSFSQNVWAQLKYIKKNCARNKKTRQSFPNGFWCMCLFFDSFTLDCQLATINLRSERHWASENASSIKTSYHHNFCLLYSHQMICLFVIGINRTVYDGCKSSKNISAWMESTKQMSQRNNR